MANKTDSQMNMKRGLGLRFGIRLFAARTGLGVLLIILLIMLFGPFLPACPTASASNPAVWSLVWSDEFDGPSGSAVDASKWSFDLGGNGWGNKELETYTSRTANARLDGGSLVINALKETFTGSGNITRNYTSARLLPKNKCI